MSQTDEHLERVWDGALKTSGIQPHRLAAAMAHLLRSDLSFDEFMTKVVDWHNRGASEGGALNMIVVLGKDP